MHPKDSTPPREPNTTCANCGAPVYMDAYRARQPGKKYCSKACVWIGMQRRITFACEQCGEETSQPLSQYNCHKTHVCSPACHDALRRTTMRGANNPAFRSGGALSRCAHCGVELVRPQNQVQKARRQFCNATCYGLWQRGRFTGPASPTWRGGSVEDRGPDWTRQSRAARERDGFACQLCGTQRLVHAHHIKPFREFGYIRGLNDHYKAANALPNLISLCASCHTRVEHGTLALPDVTMTARC